MAKASPEPRLEAGERLLADWGVAADAEVAALAAHLHRDPDADLAIAQRLGGLAEQASARALRELEKATSDKQVRKAAKRALYRLEQRGIRLPAEPAAPAPAAAVGPALEGYVSAVDGRGDQLVWLLKPQPGGVAHLFTVINDPEGMREAVLSAVTRKALKELQQELERKHAMRLVRVDWRYADFLMHRAFSWARAGGTRMEGDYPALRNQLLRQPAAEDLPPSAFTHVDPASVPEAALESSPALLEELELRTWFLGPDELTPYLQELASVRDSPLVLNRAQQMERFEQIIAGAVEEHFGAASRPSWERRLYEMAYFFAVTRRRERAEEAVATGRALGQGRPAAQIPFCAVLVRTSLAALFHAAVEEEEEREKSSLILTPQQAARQRERR
jgi:hypothetical protein